MHQFPTFTSKRNAFEAVAGVRSQLNMWIFFRSPPQHRRERATGSELLRHVFLSTSPLTPLPLFAFSFN